MKSIEQIERERAIERRAYHFDRQQLTRVAFPNYVWEWHTIKWPWQTDSSVRPECKELYRGAIVTGRWSSQRPAHQELPPPRLTDDEIQQYATEVWPGLTLVRKRGDDDFYFTCRGATIVSCSNRFSLRGQANELKKLLHRWYQNHRNTVCDIMISEIKFTLKSNEICIHPDDSLIFKGRTYIKKIKFNELVSRDEVVALAREVVRAYKLFQG